MPFFMADMAYMMADMAYMMADMAYMMADFRVENMEKVSIMSDFTHIQGFFKDNTSSNDGIHGRHHGIHGRHRPIEIGPSIVRFH